MDTNSSGEDVLIKIRKPYTISKQRERWTEEEHNRFLEALKLHGRAWQRIEEHVGTKTAVQIRSHAQKFFSKLEKEALGKGVPISKALDIITPPRPKRKPSNPYPRKIGACASTLQAAAKDGRLLTSVSYSPPGNQILDLENVPIPAKPGQVEEPENSKENQDGRGSDVFTIFQEAPCISVSSPNKNFRPITMPHRESCSFREFVPSSKELINQDETNEPSITVEPKANQRLDKSESKETIPDNGASQASNLGIENYYNSQEKIIQEKTKNPMHLKLGVLSRDEMQATQNYPRHIPVHILVGSLGTCTQTSPGISYQESEFHQGIHGHSSRFTSLATSAPIEHEANVRRSSIHQSFPTFHPPFTPFCDNHEDYQSFVQFSSFFSSLIMSTLLQNPAAHAAASFAASFWPCSNVKASAESPACTLGGFLLRQMNPSPSMEAIAAATVAAATAWWAAHGLLPLCNPLHSGFPCTPASASASPSMETGQAPAAKTERMENTLQDPPLKDQQVEAEYSEAFQAQHSASKLPISLTSDSESGGGKLDIGSKAAEPEKVVAATDLHDSNETKGRNQVDRSSCGSNTPSSSEIETDALEKHEKAIEESNEPDTGHPTGDSMNRRSRSTCNLNESWKEVSEEGRLAFQALFTRHVLPQSFSPPHDLKNKGHQKKTIEEDKQNADEKDEDPMLLDLNSKTRGSCFSQGIEEIALLMADNREEELLVGHGKLKARTGFKPYKRCSAEAEESRVANASFQDEEKCPKRICLDGEALT